MFGISYNRQRYLGCSSENFIKKGYQLITRERLFQEPYHKSLNRDIYAVADKEKRLQYIVKNVEELPGREILYSEEIKQRVLQIIIMQRRKYEYLME